MRWAGDFRLWSRQANFVREMRAPAHTLRKVGCSCSRVCRVAVNIYMLGATPTCCGGCGRCLSAIGVNHAVWVVGPVIPSASGPPGRRTGAARWLPCNSLRLEDYPHSDKEIDTPSCLRQPTRVSFMPLPATPVPRPRVRRHYSGVSGYLIDARRSRVGDSAGTGQVLSHHHRPSAYR